MTMLTINLFDLVFYAKKFPEKYVAGDSAPLEIIRLLGKSLSEASRQPRSTSNKTIHLHLCCVYFRVDDLRSRKCQLSLQLFTVFRSGSMVQIQALVLPAFELRPSAGRNTEQNVSPVPSDKAQLLRVWDPHRPESKVRIARVSRATGALLIRIGLNNPTMFSCPSTALDPSCTSVTCPFAVELGSHHLLQWGSELSSSSSKVDARSARSNG
jgi:hypothetical protein